MKRHLLEALIHFIIGVCVFDIYCTSMAKKHLLGTERNFIARALIIPNNHKVRIVSGPDYKLSYLVIEDNDVSRLVLFKVLGMLAAKACMSSMLTRCRVELSAAVIVSVAVVQLWLLVFLLS